MLFEGGDIGTVGIADEDGAALDPLANAGVNRWAELR